MATSLEKAAERITDSFNGLEKHVFNRLELSRLFGELQEEWKIAKSTSFKKFIDFTTSDLSMKQIALRSETAPKIDRFIWGKVSNFEIALAIRPKSYLSHAAAVYLHGLTEEIPKSLYVNREQSPKPSFGSLAQERIKLAFSRPQRMSNYAYKIDQQRAVLISGKSTGQLEVGTVTGPYGEKLPVTKIERTLIDIVVRPAYAGGILQVLEAFKSARDRISVNVLTATLKKMNYIYPYHQAIGFLLERAGYDGNRLKPLRSIKIDFDFYLVHGMKNPQYNKKWRLFIPQGI